uniref:Uncharacterized protein n=1 Tax=Arundo donax TaxID=35708 RepID=A0A0A8Y5G9_ARUDO
MLHRHQSVRHRKLLTQALVQLKGIQSFPADFQNWPMSL